MPLYIPEDFGQVICSIKLDTDNEPMAITFGVNGATETDDDEFVGEIADNFRETFKVNFDDHWTLGPVTLRINRSGLPYGPLNTHVDPTLQVGTGAAYNPLPQNCAILVHKRTVLAGRQGRGRFYLPGPGESVVSSNGTIDAGTVTGLQAEMTAFLDTFNTPGNPVESGLWLLHNRTDQVATDRAPTEITALQVDPVIATQRRRLRP